MFGIMNSVIRNATRQGIPSETGFQRAYTLRNKDAVQRRKDTAELWRQLRRRVQF